MAFIIKAKANKKEAKFALDIRKEPSNRADAVFLLLAPFVKIMGVESLKAVSSFRVSKDYGRCQT